MPTTPEADILEDDTDLASVTQIPTAFNAEAGTAAPEESVEDTPETVADKPQSGFMKWMVEKNEMIKQRGLDLLHGLGKAGLMLVDTWKDPDLSVEKKVEGTLAAGVSAAGEVVKGSILMGPAAGLISMIPGETAPRVVESFVGGAVDSATGLLVKENKDGTVGFNGEAIPQFVSKKGLIGVGINAAVAGVGSAMSSADQESTAFLDKKPDSKYAGAAELIKKAHSAYKSPAGQALVGAAASAATKRFTRA